MTGETSTPGWLRIGADGFALPLDAVTETFAILAKRGKGKTYTASVLVEELIDAGQPVVVVDPVGVWWGLRSSADGSGDGLPVVIFGGDHADVPLEPAAGTLIADVIVDQRIPAVIDLSGLSKSGGRRFMADFAERLYHRNRAPLHLVLDEADAFAPQRTHADGARLLGAIEDLVRRGRARGIGVTLITQRPAVLNKDVLTQAEVLVALGMTGPRDVAAIDEWVRLHADEDEAARLKASLPSLPTGTAWIWSPGWLGVLEQVRIRARRTFDSSATPKAGGQRVEPQGRADIDLAALGVQIAETVERQKADDPNALRARIRDLERELATALAARPEPQVVERPVLAESVIAQLTETAEDIVSELRWWRRNQPAPEPAAAQRPELKTIPRPEPATTPTSGTVALSKAERAILTAVLQRPGRPKTVIAFLAGYSSKSSGFSNALGSLRSKGLIDKNSAGVSPLPGAAEALGDYELLPTGPALLDVILGRLGKAEKAILQVLVDVAPKSIDRDELAERAGYSANSSGYSNALGRLRSLELCVRGDHRATDELMESLG